MEKYTIVYNTIKVKKAINSAKAKIMALENKVSLIFTITVILGLLSTLIDWPQHKHIHWNGDEGFRFHWHLWVIKTYFCGFFLSFSRLLKEMTDIDRDVVFTYILFDIYSFIVYQYAGWPERKDLIIIGFCIACIIFRLKRIWTKAF